MNFPNSNSPQGTSESIPFEGATPEDRTREGVVEALLQHRLSESRASMNARVARAMDRVHADGAASAASGARGHSRWQLRAGMWGSGVAAAFVFSAILIMGQPSSANVVLDQARAAERVTADRRYEVTVELPQPPQANGKMLPIFMAGALDVRDAKHIRLSVLMPDGKQTVRAINGSTSWVQRPDGVVMRLPEEAPWPRWIETPSGDLLVDRLDALLDDVKGHYEVQRCGGTVPEGAGNMERVCATRKDDTFRGPEKMEIWVDPQSHEVVRAHMQFSQSPKPEGPRTGEGQRSRGGEGARGGEGPRGGEASRGGAEAPRGGEGSRSGDGTPRGEGARGAEGRGGQVGGPMGMQPKSIVIKRVPLPAGGFSETHFAPPSEPKERSAQERADRDRPERGDRPDRGERPDRGDRPRHDRPAPPSAGEPPANN